MIRKGTTDMIEPLGTSGATHATSEVIYVSGSEVIYVSGGGELRTGGRKVTGELSHEISFGTGFLHSVE
jgi:hypothetical protein